MQQVNVHRAQPSYRVRVRRADVGIGPYVRGVTFVGLAHAHMRPPQTLSAPYRRRIESIAAAHNREQQRRLFLQQQRLELPAGQGGVQGGAQ